MTGCSGRSCAAWRRHLLLVRPETVLRWHRRGWWRAAGTWHLDEVQLKIKGTKHWLWRAVGRDGLVLDILVQDRRDQGAAERFRQWRDAARLAPAA